MKKEIPIVDLSQLIQTTRGVLGIDPGKSGAGVALVGRQLYARRDFKTLESISRGIGELLGSTYSLSIHSVVIEAVHAMPGQGVTSMFNFGTAFGVAQGTVWTVCDLPVTFVSPQKWQNWIKHQVNWPVDKPFNSREVALSLFPEQAELFKRKLDHNTADAALMALWGKAQL